MGRPPGPKNRGGGRAYAAFGSRQASGEGRGRALRLARAYTQTRAVVRGHRPPGRGKSWWPFPQANRATPRTASAGAAAGVSRPGPSRTVPKSKVESRSHH